jgi:hypothetical protein
MPLQDGPLTWLWCLPAVLCYLLSPGGCILQGGWGGDVIHHHHHSRLGQQRRGQELAVAVTAAGVPAAVGGVGGWVA